MSPSVPKLAAALVAAQKAMPAVERDSTNPHFGSRFTSLDHLIAKTRPVLNAHDLAIVQFPSTKDGAPVLCTILVHGESGEQLMADAPLLFAKQDMQGFGAAVTYARRYAWASVCGIADEEDDDGNAASAPVRAQTSSAGTTSAQAKANGSDGAPAEASLPKGQPDTAPAGPPSDGFAPPSGAQAEAALFTFPTGKHAGKTLGEVEPGYLDWYQANGPRQDVKDAIATFRGGTPVGIDDDIPF